MQRGVLNAYPDAGLAVFVIWIAMMDNDKYEAARKAACKFSDARVRQFYDPRQLMGRALAASLGHSDEIAWDMYFFYAADAIWGKLPPRPEAYAHQLRNSWADQDRCFEDDRLKAELTKTMKRLFQ